jgi:hypothetical protein
VSRLHITQDGARPAGSVVHELHVVLVKASAHGGS